MFSVYVGGNSGWVPHQGWLLMRELTVHVCGYKCKNKSWQIILKANFSLHNYVSLHPTDHAELIN